MVLNCLLQTTMFRDLNKHYYYYQKVFQALPEVSLGQCLPVASKKKRKIEKTITDTQSVHRIVSYVLNRSELC